MSSVIRATCCAAVAVAICTTAALAGPYQPSALSSNVDPLPSVARVVAPAVDLDAVSVEDQDRALEGRPPRYAIPNPVSITPATDGTWQQLDEQTWMWRLRISSPGAAHLNLGFTRYFLPPKAQLMVYAADLSHVVRPFTAADNSPAAELWTPVVLADDVVVELTVPEAVIAEYRLELTSINVGYRGFGVNRDADLRSGACNVDVVCAQGDDWWNEIPAVAVISTGGSTFCSGFMVNNTAADRTPYFMTAYHCEITAGEAPSLVTYWNYQNSTCRRVGSSASGGPGDGALDQFNTGSVLKAAYSVSDFTLVRLNSNPDPDWHVTYAGWDRSSNNATSAVGIHHPNTDEKRISFEYAATTTTSYLGAGSPGDSTHVRITDWDLGTTEGGSSGSPLFDQNHRVIGQLHGGYAACGNDDSDWYGRFYTSWTGNGTSSTRLSNWLDAAGTGAMSVDTINPAAAGLGVTPDTGLAAEGPSGGPFAPNSVAYTLENKGDYTIEYSVSKTQAWLSVTNASGTLTAHATVAVTVSVNAAANGLANGHYADNVTFINTTDHLGDATRPVTLDVGVPLIQYAWNMDANPGFTTQGAWAWGHPTGGGSHNGDPSNGYTGANVYGYNLSGDYANNLTTTYYLTTPALNFTDRSSVTLTFWRWLGVEYPTRDHATIQVSNNGADWTTLWSNPLGVSVSDTSWTKMTFDLSTVADDRPTVYLRWGMGSTDSTVTFPGWNIDDIEIRAIVEPPSLPTLLGADSVGTTCTLPLANDQTEPRAGGIRRLDFHFDKPPAGSPTIQSATCAVPAFELYSGVSTRNCTVVGNDLRCTFTPALENARTYRFDFAGIALNDPTFDVHALIGDANLDGTVNGTDRSTVVGAWTGAGTSCSTDLNEDGVTNGSDRSLLIGRWTDPAANCTP